jgi:hypothetical protein
VDDVHSIQHLAKHDVLPSNFFGNLCKKQAGAISQHTVYLKKGEGKKNIQKILPAFFQGDQAGKSQHRILTMATVHEPAGLPSIWMSKKVLAVTSVRSESGSYA